MVYSRPFASSDCNASEDPYVPATNRLADCPFLIGRRSNRRPIRKLLDFDFLRGLAPGRLDGFSIERYEKNCGFFDLYAAKFESGAMRFWGEKSPRRWNPFKTSFHPCLSIIKNSQRRTQIHSKSPKNRF